ncbi:MAG TPA: hypothetical protein PK104_06470 [Spirochaetota bacterium]|jgi:hypothetical protein|nr:hypothetical protein [Spirochaetota bacterium]HPX92502.1 hypothetical protein [Spirochaetota bacterium]
MPGRLSVEVYEIFERNFNNKEDALKIINAFEETINESVSVSWYKTKNEMLSEIFSVVATKEDLRSLRVELLGEMKKDKAEILGRLYALYEKTEKDKAELLGMIEQNKTELLGIIEQNKTELLGMIEQNKTELLGIIEQNKTELLGMIESNRIELNAKIDTIYLKLDRKITLWSFSIIFIIIFLNQNALEFIAKIIGLIK